MDNSSPVNRKVREATTSNQVFENRDLTEMIFMNLTIEEALDMCPINPSLCEDSDFWKRYFRKLSPQAKSLGLEVLIRRGKFLKLTDAVKLEIIQAVGYGSVFCRDFHKLDEKTQYHILRQTTTFEQLADDYTNFGCKKCLWKLNDIQSTEMQIQIIDGYNVPEQCKRIIFGKLTPYFHLLSEEVQLQCINHRPHSELNDVIWEGELHQLTEIVQLKLIERVKSSHPFEELRELFKGNFTKLSKAVKLKVFERVGYDDIFGIYFPYLDEMSQQTYFDRCANRIRGFSKRCKWNLHHIKTESIQKQTLNFCSDIAKEGLLAKIYKEYYKLPVRVQEHILVNIFEKGTVEAPWDRLLTNLILIDLHTFGPDMQKKILSYDFEGKLGVLKNLKDVDEAVRKRNTK
jgi:hypothetical protein